MLPWITSSSVVPDEGLRIALHECSYAYPEKTKEDIEQIKTKYTDLHVHVNYYGGLERKLVNLNVPVACHGCFYPIHVRIWLHTLHPYKTPKCYLTKTVNINLKPGEHIGEDGYINLKYVREWTHPNSHLLGLTEEMEYFLEKEISLHFSSVSWGNGTSQPVGVSPQVSKVAPIRSPVFGREEATNIVAHSQKQRLNHNISNNLFDSVEDAFQSLTLDKIVETYKLKMFVQSTPDSKHAVDADTARNISQSQKPSDKNIFQTAGRLSSKLPIGKHKMFQDLCHLKGEGWSEEDVREAVCSCPNYASALQYLSHECVICCNQHPFHKFVTMTHCSCSFCESCFNTYFSSVIKEKSIIHVVCPLCKKPDLEKQGSTEETMEFFNLLDTQIRHYLDQETHELFQRKLRDRTLMQMPNFRWCSHCSFGLLHEAARLRMDCPSCSKSTCINCKEPWKEQHEGISCDEFKRWKLNNQPNYQEERLNVYLTKNGIDCPCCKFRFDLSKGGCLHFKCTQCRHEFCGGCRRPFKVGSDCGFSPDCHGKGLHAHHSRSCFYYLRDWDIKRLHQLLEQRGIHYKSDLIRKAPGRLKGVCNVMEQWETETRIHNENMLGDNDVCEADYKEFLVKIINSNSLDPADVYTESEMKAELQRRKLEVPDNQAEESREFYLQSLQMKIKEQIPLDVDYDYYKES
ncbi:E3 ubiquitin-protein ligase RNF31-like isoform X2 [Ascaphus truei]|uniref:E3 ubiquitin-protein ligase RNF31-like isoform X2 n=1 Tax=Ascaphus truei TaxID=8439 RepID=UPI003F59841A